MKIARRLLALAILAAMFAPLGGCASVGSTKEENERAVNRSLSYDQRMLMDDLGLLFQIDRPRRTSRWVID